MAGRSIRTRNAATFTDGNRAIGTFATRAPTLARGEIARAATLAFRATGTAAGTGALVAVEALERTAPPGRVAARIRVPCPVAVNAHCAGACGAAADAAKPRAR